MPSPTRLGRLINLGHSPFEPARDTTSRGEGRSAFSALQRLLQGPRHECHRFRTGGVDVVDDNPSVRLVCNYIEAAQRARASGDAGDFSAVRGFLADDVVTKMASPWTDQPWQVKQQGADAMVGRLKAPINAAVSLTTENVNVQLAGDDVLVEQLSTIVNSE